MRLLSMAACLVSVVLATTGGAQAQTVRLTIYDDGFSCPANCDAHAVFHPSLNGTEFAHGPASLEPPYARCDNGDRYRICLEAGTRQCLEAVYRGGGPSPMTFDFTPAFYSAACSTTPEQPLLADKCDELRRAARSLDGRVNCIATPEHDSCGAMIGDAEDRHARDRVEYDRCPALGEARYNRDKPIAQQRSLRCAYEKRGTGGPNSAGTTWRRLLPGACRDGSFVGRDGLDCCSGNTFADGPLGIECRSFYPVEPSS